MAEVRSKCHCCVPLCKTTKQRQPYLSFHGFPSDMNERKKWVQAIRREEGQDFTVLRGSTFVCSLHFNEVDYAPTTGRKRLKTGAVPSRFHWSKWAQQESVCEGVRGLEQDARADISVKESRCENITPGLRDHDYAAAPTSGALDLTSVHIQQLEEEVQTLETELTQVKAEQLHFHRFCVSDEDIRVYTRFTSKETFHAFWEAVQPSASLLVYWSKAQTEGRVFAPTPTPVRRLQLIDEFFLYCCCVATGLKENKLADIFQISESTVCRTVITWANYLYLLLGSLPTWMSRKEVNSSMPLKFRLYNPEVRVIVGCTEVQCQSPSSLDLQSEVFSSYKNTTVFKGLVGVAPCGAVTFVSSLYTGSISSQELTQQCGILDLLEPGDECMSDSGFTIKKIQADHGAKLITSYIETTAQFCNEDALKTQAIAQLEILVERAISRVKQYHIWDDTLPPLLSEIVNQLWTNCCLMTNFQGSRDLKDDIPDA